MARNYNITEIPSSQNLVIRGIKSSVQTKVTPAVSQHIQPLKRNRTILIDDGSTVVPKKISFSRQGIPIQSISYTTANKGIIQGNITNMPQKLSNAGIKIKPATALKKEPHYFVKPGITLKQQQQQQQQQQRNYIKPGTTFKFGNKQYAVVQSNGAMSTTAQQQQQQPHVPIIKQETPARRPTIYIKGPTKKSMRSITMELIDKSPKLHLGISYDRLQILKLTVCPVAEIPVVDLYMTLKKIRQNEDFHLLSQYFEYSNTSSSSSGEDADDTNTNPNNGYGEILNVFIRTVCKLSKYLKYLIRWPEGKKYYDRHKNLPIAFRSKLSFVQSLVECVETEIQSPSIPTLLQSIGNNGINDCINITNFLNNLKSYKFILTMTPSGVITYVSEACNGNYDDLAVFNACNFYNAIPKYLSLVADPGVLMRRNEYTSTTTTATDSNKNIKSNQNESRKSDQLSVQSKTKTTENITKNKEDENSSVTKKALTSKNLTAAEAYKKIEELYIDCSSDDDDQDNKEIDNSEEDETKQNLTDEKSISSTILKKIISESNKSMNIVDNELTSDRIKNVKIPTLHVQESICRAQITNVVHFMREFKIIQPYNVLEPQIYQYLNEILVIISALLNLER